MAERAQIRNLTPLRGIAALVVLIFHYHLFAARLVPADASYLMNKLYLMVDLFFVLSGFIMYHVYGESFRSGVSMDKLGPFLRARFARIYPLHIATLMLVIAMYLLVKFLGTPLAWWSNVLDESAILSHVLMLQGMGTHQDATWNTPAWSISVEWWAYMLFPFLVLALAKGKHFARVLLMLAIVSGYVWVINGLQPAFWADNYAHWGFPEDTPFDRGINVFTGLGAFVRCICAFSVGMFIFEVYQAGWAKSYLKSGIVFVLCWVVLLVLWHLNQLNDIGAIAIIAVMILSAAWNNGRLSDFLSRRILQNLGDWSYSMYLIHTPILIAHILYRKTQFQPDLLERPDVGFNFSVIETWLGFSVYLIVVLFLSYLSYRYLEKPARNYINIKRMGSNLSPV